MQISALDLPQLILDLRADLRQRFRFHRPERQGVFLSWLLDAGSREYASLREDGRLCRWMAQTTGPGPLTRLQAMVWQWRSDVQAAFALPQELEPYLAWFYRHGVGEHDLWPWLTPAERRQACLTEGPWQAALLERATDELLQHEPPATAARPWGVNLIGYVHGQLGIGEDVRMAARALEAVGVPYAMVNFRPGHDIPQHDQSLAHKVVDEGPYAINLFCLTALEHGRFYAERGGRQLQGRYNIGYWPWELAQWPGAWQQLVHLVDEVWVSTQHTLQAVAPLCQAATPPVPVQAMPMAVLMEGTPRQGAALQRARRAVRRRWGLPSAACLFCFSFDLNSSIHRKNPQAVLRAFLKAFPLARYGPGQVGLVIKVHPPRQPHPAWERLKRLAAQDPRLHMVEQTLPKADLLGLYQACDAFVSLHRAEGFGRGIAEALQLGLRVVTTGYSGNVDFCRRPELADRVQLVRYRLVQVRPGQYPYAQGQSWASADVAHAARCLQQVASAVWQAGGALLPVPTGGWPVFSAEEVGTRYKARLQQIGAEAAQAHHVGVPGGPAGARP